MSENLNQPREYDAVIGSQIPLPIDAAVLGGIEGIKRRLENTDIEQKIAAIKEAVNYGESGLDLVIQAWRYELGKVKWTAYSLLHHREEAKVKQALQEYNPWQKISCLQTIEQDSAIKSVAISQDGKIFVSGSQKGSINVWDLQTQQMQPTSMYHRNINSLVISVNSKTLVSRGGDHECNDRMKVWDIQTRQCQRTLEEYGNTVFSLAICPDGKHFVCGDMDNSINVWDFQTEQVTRTIRGHSRYLIQALAISANGKTLISGSNDKTIKAWDFETGKLIHTFKNHSDGIMSVAISPDGQTIVSGSKDKTIKVWNLKAKKLERTIEGHSGWVYCIALSTDGSTIVSGSRDRTIRIWNLYTGECQRILEGHTDWVYCLAISPDGNTLVSGSRDKTIKIWGLP